jgi:phosphoribosylpyrophosphate synthetase
VRGKTCILVDDMIDTGGTITKAAELLFENGAADVIVTATHGVLSGPADGPAEEQPDQRGRRHRTRCRSRTTSASTG